VSNKNPRPGRRAEREGLYEAGGEGENGVNPEGGGSLTQRFKDKGGTLVFGTGREKEVIRSLEARFLRHLQKKHLPVQKVEKNKSCPEVKAGKIELGNRKKVRSQTGNPKA